MSESQLLISTGFRQATMKSEITIEDSKNTHQSRSVVSGGGGGAPHTFAYIAWVKVLIVSIVIHDIECLQVSNQGTCGLNRGTW